MSNYNANDEGVTEIERLEAVLYNAQKEWDETQLIRSNKWRKHFLLSFLAAILLSVLTPKFWWVGLIVITYFAASLFTLLRESAKTSSKIIEHKKQLQLVRFLRNFESSSISQK